MISQGTTLHNRYYVDKRIGEGGFSNVYLATDLVLNRMVAVKVMDTSLEGSPEFLDRFKLEAQSVAKLNHPYILTIYDFGLVDESAFLVMPYLAGGPLSVRMRSSRLTLDEVALYLEQISAALDYAHREGVVHRDVKPQNVLLWPDGRSALTDFGFAKQLSSPDAEAHTRVLGTVHYMAPEQFQGRVSASTDQYSLGVLLYQMISNVLPFNGMPQQMILGHISYAPPSLLQQPTMQNVNREITARLDEVVGRVLAKDPAMRYPNCETLYNAYRGAIQTRFYIGGGRPPIIENTEIDLPPIARLKPIDPPHVRSQPTPPSVPTPPKPMDDSEATHPYPSGQMGGPLPLQAPLVMLQPPRLAVYTEPDQHVRLTFTLSQEVLTLGRELSNDLQIPLSTVSRHHATLYRVGPVGPGMRYRIVDNKSRNQLSHKGLIVSERFLEDGDVLEIGKRGYGDYVVFLTYSAPVFGPGSGPSRPGPALVNPSRPAGPPR